MKTKGARLTTEISLPGRFLVYVPNGEGLGVSRRLEDAERQRLKDILKGIAALHRRRDRPHGGGRGVGRGHRARPRLPPAALEDDPGAREVGEAARPRVPGGRAPPAHRARPVRRRLRRRARRQRPDAPAHRRVPQEDVAPHGGARPPHKDKEPLFERFGVEKELASTLDRRVDLPSGGYLVFDYAEAFTVIDVNTGRFVGSRSKSSTQRLEDTI